MKQRIKNWLLKNLLGAVVITDVATEANGKLLLGGKEVTDIEVNSLIAEAKALESMRVWQILNETPKQKAFERGWLKSTTLDELNTGKTMYATLELQQSLIRLIKKQQKK